MPQRRQAGVEGTAQRVGGEVLVPDLAGEADVLAANGARAQRGADRGLVAVHLRRIDVAVAALERALDRAAAFVVAHPPCAKTERGQGQALDPMTSCMLSSYVFSEKSTIAAKPVSVPMARYAPSGLQASAETGPRPGAITGRMRAVDIGEHHQAVGEAGRDRLVLRVAGDLRAGDAVAAGQFGRRLAHRAAAEERPAARSIPRRSSPASCRCG